MSALRKKDNVSSELQSLKKRLKELERENKKLAAELAGPGKSGASEELYRNIFNATGDGIFVHDKDTGRIIDVNEAVSRMYGFSRQELLARKVADLSSDETPYTEKEAQKWIRRAIKGGPQSFSWLARKKSGDLFWVQVDLTPAVIGGKERVLAVVRDMDAKKKAEQIVIDSEQRYRTLFQLSPEGIALLDSQGIIIDVNPAFCRLRGYKREALLGQHISIFVPPEDKEECLQNIKEIIAGKELNHEVVDINYDGSKSIIELHEKRILLPDNSWGILSISQDVTQRRKTENALRESEYRFRSIFEENKAVLLIIDPRTMKIIQANTAAEQYYGYSFKDLIGMDYQEIAVNHAQENYSFIRRVLETSGATLLGRQRMAGGEIRDVEILASPVLSGAKNYVFLIVHDISERKKAQHQASFLASVIEQSVEDVIITDTEGSITYVNPAFSETTGYSPEEVLGQNPRILKSGKQDAAFYEELWQTISSGKKWQGVFINKRKDGSLYFEKAIIFPVKDELEQIINYVGILRDISYERKLEEQVQQMQKLEAIGTLAGGIAHDFNNLLTVINGHAELALMRIPNDNKAHRDIISILSAGKRAQKLTNQLLAFSRKQLYELRVINLNNVISDLEKMMRRLITEDIRMELDLQPDLPYVKADPSQIEQILINLIINARDAITEHKKQTKNRFIRISSSVFEIDEAFREKHPGSTAGKHVLIKVADSGMGMDEQTMARIFDPFFTTKEVGKGTGLGLSTVYGIVKQNESYIEVKSLPGKGTEFSIFWPVTSKKPEAGNPQAEQSRLPRGQADILLVEDDPAVRDFAASALLELGYTVHVAENGLQALELYEKNSRRIECLITDLIMPGLNGWELSKKIQKSNPQICVIYVSGYTYQHLIREGSLEAGVHFIQKPYSMRSLSGLIKKVMPEK